MLHLRSVRRLLTVLAVLAASSACGDIVRQGRSPVVLVMEAVEGASGASTKLTFNTVLFSDVITNVTSPAPCAAESPCPTVFADSGRAIFHLQSKNVTIEPSANNQVTITRVRIVYRRTDGRNTPGIDVPFAFDQGITVTVPPTDSVNVPFELVRHVAKAEPPLVQLITNPNIIHAIADITFYGTDLVGNDISATGSVSIEFGNFGDER